MRPWPSSQWFGKTSETGRALDAESAKPARQLRNFVTLIFTLPVYISTADPISPSNNQGLGN